MILQLSERRIWTTFLFISLLISYRVHSLFTCYYECGFIDTVYVKSYLSKKIDGPIYTQSLNPIGFLLQKKLGRYCQA
uniref:Putative secreted protein n=1 Tax=Anopheles triannulatus TaxID=58253 RepID=A0A2M4B7C9_9DIPT